MQRLRNLPQLALPAVAMLMLAACTEPLDLEEAASPSLAELLGTSAAEGFLRADAPSAFSFPLDHGPHPGFRNEWWYVTGNLDGDDGQRYGYEFTLFRFELKPPQSLPAASPVDTVAGAPEDPVPVPAAELPVRSAWSANEVFIGHFAISDPAKDRFHFAETFARGAAGLAGADSAPLRLWVYDWQLRRRDGQRADWQLVVQDGPVRLELTLDALKAPVLNGLDGRSQKSAEASNASYYYSIPRLKTQGELQIGERRIQVEGLSWLDREWSSSALDDDQAGWDWFAFQLDDGTELMFYQLRHNDGTVDVYSAGSFIDAAGKRFALLADDVVVDVLDHWDSPLGGRYPHGWRMRIPSRAIDLRIQPIMAAQELATWVRYWEGAVDVSGTRGAESVAGRGYVELTGYAGRAASLRP